MIIDCLRWLKQSAAASNLENAVVRSLTIARMIWAMAASIVLPIDSHIITQLACLQVKCSVCLAIQLLYEFSLVP